MFRITQEDIERTKRFVSKHRTPIAMGVTAVVVHRVTKRNTMRFCYTTVADRVYSMGRGAGEMEAALFNAYNFISQKDLMDQFVNSFDADNIGMFIKQIP